MRFIQRALERFSNPRPARLIESGGGPYMYRVFLFSVFGWNAYLHHFVSADAERWLHDHPFNGLAIVLSGEYVEERLVAFGWPEVRTKLRHVNLWNWISGHTFHRIIAPAPNTWTLFLHSPKFKGWGFLYPVEEPAGIAYINPYGNVGAAKWWEGAPTYKQLRSGAAWRDARATGYGEVARDEA